MWFDPSMTKGKKGEGDEKGGGRKGKGKEGKDRGAVQFLASGHRRRSYATASLRPNSGPMGQCYKLLTQLQRVTLKWSCFILSAAEIARRNRTTCDSIHLWLGIYYFNIISTFLVLTKTFVRFEDEGFSSSGERLRKYNWNTGRKQAIFDSQTI